MNTGIYFNGKVYYRTPQGIEVYIVINRHEWWAEARQEVLFELIDGKAFIKKLGEVKSPQYVESYCGEF